MNMPELDSIDQMANNLYYHGLGASFNNNIQPVQSDVVFKDNLPKIIPENFGLPALISFKSNTVNNSDFNPTDSYYFLKNRLRNRELESKQSSNFNCQGVRKDFPILQQRVNGFPLIWFDNAATTQKPQAVLDSLAHFYREFNSNVHRGIHTLATKATNAYEAAREKVQHFLNASSAEEIIFLRGTTEAINLVAQSYGQMVLGKGDEILVTIMEHHSNIVPWQLICQSTGATIRAIPISEQGEIKLGVYEKLLSPRTKLVALTHASNVLGTVNPVRMMIEMAHYYGAVVLIDGAQSIPHLPVDVRDLDTDFYVFSGHKIYGPTGIGALYGKMSLLKEMPPWQGGGSMIKDVTIEKTTYNELPYKFEAGTGNIADAIGLGMAIDYLQKIGIGNIERYEAEITEYAMRGLSQIRGLHLIGTTPHKIGVISFLIENISPEDLAQKMDQKGIAVRVGHHCAQPLMKFYGINGTIRISLGIYNTKDEIDFVIDTIEKNI